MLSVIHGLAGAVTGVLSAFGIGGGTLLMLYLTFLAGFSQQTAQGINLLYFLPSAGMALPRHWKSGMVDRRVAVCALSAGCLCTVGGALLAAWAPTRLLRRLFGGYLIVTGSLMLFQKGGQKKDQTGKSGS